MLTDEQIQQIEALPEHQLTYRVVEQTVNCTVIDVVEALVDGRFSKRISNFFMFGVPVVRDQVVPLRAVRATERLEVAVTRMEGVLDKLLVFLEAQTKPQGPSTLTQEISRPTNPLPVTIPGAGERGPRKPTGGVPGPVRGRMPAKK